MAGADLSITYQRSLVVEFSYPYSNDPTALMVPYPQLASTVSGVVKPFQYAVKYKQTPNLPLFNMKPL